jgi:hypothetical protein
VATRSKKGLSSDLVDKAFHETYENPPSTLGKNQTKDQRRKQLIAISLSKARAAQKRR